MSTTTTGKIYLIPTEMGEQLYSRLFPSYNIALIESISVYVVENIRTARRCLKKMCPSIVIDDLTFFELDKHTQNLDVDAMLDPALKGLSIGIMSEAGLPCIADPGSIVVSKAHELSLQVIPLVGPSSIIMALIASGFNGQSFAFHGYIPIKEKRQSFLMNIEQQAKRSGQTQIFMETPYRNEVLFQEMLTLLQSNTKLCIAANISTAEEFIKTKTIQEWKLNKPQLHKIPAIFVIGA